MRSSNSLRQTVARMMSSSSKLILLAALGSATVLLVKIFAVRPLTIRLDITSIMVFSMTLLVVADSMLTYLKLEEPTVKKIPSFTLIEQELEKFQRIAGESVGISVESKELIIEQVALEATSKIADIIDTEFDKRYGAARETIKKISYLESNVKDTTERLNQEVRALLRRGNLNLVLGTLTTMFAVIILIYTAVFAVTEQGSLSEILQSYLLRISVVIFIQIFGFFFLRLYRVSLSDIKYFQNEITNIQQRWLALKYALINDDKEIARIIINRLATTERNSIIRKGETSIDLERMRFDQNDTKALLSELKGLLQVKGTDT
jgi:hypothetical protein